MDFTVIVSKILNYKWSGLRQFKFCKKKKQNFLRDLFELETEVRVL